MARRASFRTIAAEYERYRPGYPEGAITWALGDEPKVVIDLGCGPGKMTAQLAQLGHHPIGLDQSIEMLSAVVDKGLVAVCGAAEAIPFDDRSAGAVTVATAFHWFDHERAVPEMRRVVHPGSRIALFTNIRDESVEWVAELSKIIGSEVAMAVSLGGAEGLESDVVAKLEGRGLFRSTEHRVFHEEQTLTADQLLGLVSTRSYIAVLPAEDRDRLLAEVRALCGEHPQLRDRKSFVLPYVTHVFRALAA